MKDNFIQHHQTFYFRAPAEAIWTCLTRPELIKQWLMGMDVECDWKVGSPYRSTVNWGGQDCWEKGTILQSDYCKVLQLEFLSSWDNLEDKPENYQRVKYDFILKDGGTELRITYDCLPAILTDERRKAMDDGWVPILAVMQKLIDIETGQKFISTKNTLFFRAPAETIWACFTQPDLVKQWLMGMEIVSDWKVGSLYQNKITCDGQVFEEKGRILQIVPNKILQVDFLSAWDNLEDKPENYQRLTHELVPKNGGFELQSTTDWLPSLYSEERQKEGEAGWRHLFPALQALIDKEAGHKFIPIKQTLFFRAPAEAVWACVIQPEKWLPGMNVECDWKMGSTYSSKATWDGQDFWEKGMILQSEPGKILQMDFLNSWEKLEDKPENYQRRTFELSPKENGVELHITFDLHPSLYTEAKHKEVQAGWRQMYPAMLEVVDNEAGYKFIPSTRSFFFRASAERVWDCVTKPELIKEWMMGMEIECDNKLGSTYRSKFMWEETECWEKGMVIQSEYGKIAQIDFITSWEKLEDKPENYQRMRYEIAPKDDGVELQITTDYLPTLYNEEKIKDMEDGWAKVIPTLKALAEA